MNKALPLDKLKGAVFGEPVAHEYHVVVSHIGSDIYYYYYYYLIIVIVIIYIFVVMVQ